MTREARREAEVWPGECAWLEPDPALALAARYPDMSGLELRDLVQIAERRAVEEGGVPKAPARHLSDVELEQVDRAAKTREWIDGFAAGGAPEEYVFRCGYLIHAVNDLAEKLAAERSIRTAMQRSRDQLLATLEREHRRNASRS